MQWEWLSLFHNVCCLSWEASVTEAWLCVGIFILMSGSCCWLSAGTSAGAIDQSLCVTWLYGLGFLRAYFQVARPYPAIHGCKYAGSSARQKLIAFSYWPQKSSSVVSASFFWLQWISSLPRCKGRGWLHLSIGGWRRACRMGDVVAAIFGKYSLPQLLYLHTMLIILLFSH